MIAKLEWTQSRAQQKIEQLQNPTVGVAINNDQQQQDHRLRAAIANATGCGLKCILLVPNLRPRFCCC